MAIEKKDAPQQTPGGEPPAPARTPQDEAAAKAAAEAEGKARTEAAQRTDQGNEEAEAALAALDIEVKKAPQEGQLPVTVEQLETVLQKAQPEQILALDASLNGAVTDEGKTAFQKKYEGSNGSLDAARIGKDISEGKLPIRELVIFSQILDETPNLLSQQDEGARKVLEGASERCKALQGALEKQVKPKFSAEQVDTVFKTYQTAYKKLLADGKKDDFLAAITDPNDKAVIEWAITAEPTVKEKTAVAEKFKDLIAKNDPEAIVQAVASEPPQMNFREGKIAKTILDDLQKVADQSAIPDSVKGLGFMAILEKLIDQLSKLAGKISAAIEKALAKKDKKDGEKPAEQPRHFAKSPLGEDKKLKLKGPWEQDKGVAFEAAKDAEIFAVEAGKVTVNGNVITVTTSGGGRIEYRNLTPEPGINGINVEAGQRIGKVGEQGLVEFRAFNQENKELNPTAFLEPYLTAEKPAAQAQTAPIQPPTPVNQPPAQPATAKTPTPPLSAPPPSPAVLKAPLPPPPPAPPKV